MRPTLSIQTVYFHESDRDDARRLGRELYELLTRPAHDPLSFGPGIPVVVGVSSENVDPKVAEMVVLIPVLGKAAFQSAATRDQVLCAIADWHRQLGVGHVLLVPTSSFWQANNEILPTEQILAILDSESDESYTTVDELILAVTRLIDPEFHSVKVFISHAEQDIAATGNAAEKIFEYVTSAKTGKAFFDAVLPLPGGGLGKQIGEADQQGVLIVVRGDAYSTRGWCQQELFAAKREGLPALTVEVLGSGEPRASRYGGNVPSIVWNDNPYRVASQAMVEWLRSRHFMMEAKRVGKWAELPELQVSSRPPELLDLVQGPLDPDGAPLILYPDPELSVNERQILREAFPRIHTVTPTTAFRQQPGRGKNMIVGTPLDGLQVAMSLSRSPDEDSSYGFTENHVDDAIIYVARTLVSAGASIAYGGDFRVSGFTTMLGQLVVDYNETGSKRADYLHSYLALPLKPDDAPEIPISIHHFGDPKEPVAQDALMPSEIQEEYQASLYFSDMRQAMEKQINARVLIGGNTKPKESDDDQNGYGGLFPGVVEEAWRSLEHGNPVYVLGGFGGAAAMVADLLDDTGEPDRGNEQKASESLRLEYWTSKKDFNDNRVRSLVESLANDPLRKKLALPAQMDELANSIVELRSQCLGSEEASLNWNGLTISENQTLFRSRDPVILASLVLKGLLAKTRALASGKLEVELVRGCVTGASQLDAIAVAAFDNVPMGGAGAALDKSVGGLASLARSKDQSLVHLYRPDIDADWLYIAPLGPLSSGDRLTARVEEAAASTAKQVLRHGFRRLGVVTFGGAVLDTGTVAAAMLRGFASLNEQVTLSWYETGSERHAKLKSFLQDREGLKLTTRDASVGRPLLPVAEKETFLQVSLADEQLSITVLPPSGTAIAKSRQEVLSQTELERYDKGVGEEDRTTPSMDSLRKRGEKLATLLLGDQADEFLTRTEGTRVVVIHDLASSRLPFETLATAEHRPATGTGITRRLAVSNVSIERLFSRPVRSEKLQVVLVVNPTRDLPASKQEADEVKKALADFPDSVEVKEYREDEATKENVLDALANADVLHYCGHAYYDGPGDTESGLILAGRNRLALRDLNEASTVPRFVFFNACEAVRVGGQLADSVTSDSAAFAEFILRAGVEAFVGTYWRVIDNVAAEFASGVYLSLASGETLEKAVTQARDKLHKNNLPDWANYILYGDGRFRLSTGLGTRGLEPTADSNKEPKKDI